MPSPVVILESSALVGFGGGQQVSLAMAHTLTPDRRVLVADAQDGRAMADACQRMNVPWVGLWATIGHLPSSASPAFALSWPDLIKTALAGPKDAWTLYHLLRQRGLKRPILVVAHKRGIIPALWLRLVVGCPVIFHNHNAYGGWQRPLMGLIARTFDQRFHVSRFARDLVGDPEGLVLYNPSPSWSRHHPSPRRPGPLRVGYIGKLLAWKGPQVAIAAVRDVPGIQLEVAGDGPDGPALRASAGANVRFHGFVADVEKFITNLDVVVIPACGAESFSLVTLEALWASRPVIVTTGGGQEEIAKNAAVLVPPGDALAIRDALIRLRDDDAWYLDRAIASHKRADDFPPHRFATSLRQALDLLES